MTELAAAFIWSALQVTVFAGLVSLFIFLGRNRISGICGDVLTVSMGLILAFTFFAIVPVPSWISSNEKQTADTTPLPSESNPTSFNGSAPHQTTTTPSPDLAVVEFEESQTTPFTSELNATLGKWWSEFQHSPSIETEVAESQRRIPWLWIVGVPLLLTVSIGLLKLILGFTALARLRRSSHDINDPRLLQLIRLMSIEIGVKREVKAIETHEMLTAATIGWLKPIILLPAEWRDWSESELSSAIAHELAHVSNNDFAHNLIAQLAVALNFFNPLVHWLGRELRVSQELIADEKAAAANGGRKTYLLTMAEMALKQDTNQLGWLAQPFLPTRTTFLRRIEMLKGKHQLCDHRSTLGVSMARLSLVAIAIACIGFRAPAQPLNAQDKNADRNAEVDDSWNQLEFVADTTQLFFAADLEKLRKIENISGLLDRIDQIAESDGSTFFYDLKKSQTITIQLSQRNENQRQPRVGMVLRTLDPLPAIDSLEGTPFTYRDHQCIDAAGPCIHFKDSNTIVFASDRGTLQSMLDSPRGPQVSEWRNLHKQLGQRPIFLALSELGFEQLPILVPPLNSGELDLFSPLWKDVRCVCAGISIVDDTATLDLLVHSKTEEKREQVQTTFNSLSKLSINALDSIKVKRLKDHKRIQVGKTFLENMVVTDTTSNAANPKLKPGQFNVESQMATEDFADLVELGSDFLLGGVQITSEMNNLRMVALAMHNYESAYGHFPASSIVAPGSEHPHSWRIAILPYMEYGHIHDKYRFNEPWDSEHNSRITSEMPDVFRFPGAPKDSTTSGIYFFTGEKTAFPKGKQSEFTDIIDGTSNTILAVQSDEEIHWAKPQDIEYDSDDPEAAEKLMKRLAGTQENIIAAFFDGSVRQIHRSLVDQLPLLIDPADQKPIDLSYPKD